jgi:hypothetical protein
MGKVNFDISMSLDGYMTAANQRPEEQMGDDGERLHEWAFGNDERDREVLTSGWKVPARLSPAGARMRTRCPGGAPTVRPARPACLSSSSVTTCPRTLR